MTADEWTERFAAALGVPAPSEEEVATLLRLASVAAHASERRAAPIACWLAAHAGIEPAEALRRAEQLGLGEG